VYGVPLYRYTPIWSVTKIRDDILSNPNRNLNPNSNPEVTIIYPNIVQQRDHLIV